MSKQVEGENKSNSSDPSIDAQQGYWDDRWSSQRSPNEWQIRRAEAILICWVAVRSRIHGFSIWDALQVG